MELVSLIFIIIRICSNLNVYQQDTDGNIEGKMVTSKDVWRLQNSKVIVHFDEESGQPIGDSGGLLGSWLGQLSNDVNLIPINYSDWRLVGPHIKERAWEVVQVTSIISSIDL